MEESGFKYLLLPKKNNIRLPKIVEAYLGYTLSCSSVYTCMGYSKQRVEPQCMIKFTPNDFLKLHMKTDWELSTRNKSEKGEDNSDL